MRRIYLIRHGETVANRDGIFRGRAEVGLSENGLAQARDLAQYFAQRRVDAVYSSPLKRAHQTATSAFPGRDVTREPLLNNLDVGAWTGRVKQEIEREDPERWRAWAIAPESLAFPDGECLDDVRRRTREFIDRIAGVSFEAIAVVSHRSVIKVLLAEVLGIRENYFWRFHLDNCSVSLLLHHPERGYTLAALNHTAHLRDFVFEWA